LVTRNIYYHSNNRLLQYSDSHSLIHIGLTIRFRQVEICMHHIRIWCLIHNAHVGKILCFLQNFKSQNNTLKENYWLIFLFDICHCNAFLAFKSKDYYSASQNCVYFIRKNFQNLYQKCKWALWMRHLWNNLDLRSYCLIYNTHVGKILSFWKISELKITPLKEMFHNYFHLTSTILFLAWTSKVKTIILYHKIMCIRQEKICKTKCK
jgi:hypothetical protein